MKKVFSALLSITILLSSFCVLNSTSYAYVCSSGECGYNVTYTFDFSTGELVIKGTGPMDDEYDYRRINHALPFRGDSKIKTVVVQSNVTHIGSEAFKNCKNLSSVIIYGKVDIGMGAFSGCSGLKDFYINELKDGLGLAGCTQLSNIKINKIDSIACGAFNDTAFYNDSKNWYDDALYLDKALIKAQFNNRKNYIIKEGTRIIAERAFANCSGIDTIYVPNTVTWIGEDAFQGCDRIVYAGNAAPIYSGGVYDYTWGARIRVGAIDDGFSYEDSAKTTIKECISNHSEIVIPYGVIKIGYEAFKDNTNIRKIIIPDTVTEIDSYAFENCSAIVELTLPVSVDFGYNCFSGCNNIKTIHLTKGNGALQDLEKGFNYGRTNYSSNTPWANSQRLENVVVDEGVQSIGAYAFFKSEHINNVVLPESLESVGDFAFADSNIDNLVCKGKMKYLGDNAFYNCEGLNSLIIADDAIVCEKAIYGCYNLKELTIPCDVYEDTSYSYYAYGGLNGIKKLTLTRGDSGNMYSRDNDSNSWHEFVWEYSRKSIKEIIIEEGVTSISKNAFSNMSSLVKVTLPNSLLSIGQNAFLKCSSLETIALGKSLFLIGRSAFSDCSKLTNIAIPKAVGVIAAYAFDNCNKLKNIFYSGTKKQWQGIEIDSSNSQLIKASVFYGYSKADLEIPIILNNKVSNFRCVARTKAAQTVTWNNIKNAIGYQVQISTKDGKKWSTYANLKAGVTSYTFKTLAAGNNYKFRVRFYIIAPDGTNNFSPWSTTINSPTLPSGTTLTKLTAGSKAFTAQWKQNKTVNGYQIQYSTNSKFTGAKTVTLKSNKTLKITVKKLSAKKVYYVRIRTYKTISKVNYFSTWSKAVKVKTK